MMDGQKIFANDRKTLFGEQEMHVRHPAVQRIFYGNNCSLCLPFLHGINGILEGKARKRYAIGRISERRSEEHTSELKSLMRISYAVFCLKKKNKQLRQTTQLKSLKYNINTLP